MRKNVFIDPLAKKELHQFERIVQKEFSALFDALETKGKLDYPDAKKVDKYLFEIRVKVHNIYRGFYAYIENDQIVVLHIFQKKTQKTPLQNLKTAHKRLKQYDE